MSHYDTLGVDKDATPDEIKKAWRRKSSAAHPDRQGGSTEAQQAVNRAYEVLCNPDARARYDETGQDGPQATTPQQEAEAMLARFFSDALSQSGPILPFVYRCLDNLEAEAREAIVDLGRKVERLTKRRAAIMHPDPANPFHALVEAQVQQLGAQRASAEVLLTITPIVRRLLDEYESAEEAPPPRPMFAFDPGVSAAFEGWGPMGRAFR